MDAEPTAAFVSPDVAANLSTWPSPMSVEQALARIREAKALRASREAIDLAIIDTRIDQLLGWVGLKRTGEGQARLGYWLETGSRGRGLMKEAVAAAVPLGSDFLAAPSVVAHVLEANIASIAVLEACGFRRTGEELLYRQTAGRSDLCLRFEWKRASSV